MTGWWSQRAPREQALLIAAAVLVALALVVQGVLMPTFSSRDEAKARAAQAGSTLVRLERLREAGITHVPAVSPSDPAQAASDLAAALNLVASPSPDAATGLAFTFTSADPQRVFAWIQQVETRLGLSVQSAEITAAAPGQVSATVVFAEASAP